MAENKASDIQKDVEQLREWMNKQPHFPKENLRDALLRRFLHSCYYDLEKAKNAMQLFFTIRASAPELFNNRDPLSPQVQKTLSIVNLAQISLSGNRNLWIWQLNDPGLDRYDYIQDARLFFLTTDAWLLSEDNLEEADIALLDVKDISLKFITKFNVSIAKKLSKYQEEAMPIRLKQIHIVNAPPFIDKIFALMKPFLKQDMSDMIHFHTPKSETLHQYISKDELPEDYGGTLGKMDDHMKKVVEIMMSKREYFLNDNLWKAADKKSKKGEVSTEIGSFRTLAID